MNRSHLIALLLLMVAHAPLYGDDNATAEASAIYALAKKVESVEDFTEMIGRCERFLQMPLTQEHRTYGVQSLAWALNRRGEIQSDKAMAIAATGDFNKSADLLELAHADFESAIESNPTFWRPWQNRGISFATAGEFERAINDFNRVLGMKPDYANAYINRGEVYFEIEKYDQALADFNRFIELKPDDAGAHTARGHTLFQMEKSAEALRDYDKAVSLTPESPTVYADRGDVYQHLHRWKEALADYEKSLQLSPQLYRTQRNLAWLLATAPDESIRNSKRAVELAQSARKLEGEQPNWRTLDILAAAHASAGDFENAQLQIEQAISSAPKSQHEILRQRKGQYLQEKAITQ